MPAQVPVEGVARCVIRGIANNQQIVNVFHVANDFFSPELYSPTNIATLATGIADLWKTKFMPNINSSYGSVVVECTDLSSEVGEFASAAVTGSGGVPGTDIPQSACAVVSWKIGRHYRGGHPRTYVGPLGGSAISTPTTLSSIILANLVTAATDFRAGVAAMTIGGEPQQLVALHRVRNGAPLNPVLMDRITGNTVDSRIDSQRRRLGPDR